MRRTKPSLGQNFLADHAAIARVVQSLGDVRDRVVIEVGPGKGAMTDLLAQRAGTLVAIELDRALAPMLREKHARNPRVHVMQQDILRSDLTAVVREHGKAGEKALLIGNLPYYITSDILLHLLEHADAFEMAIVMMQREVAERVAAGPGTRDYGLLSVTVQMQARAEKLFTLPPGAFSPPPDVYSTVARLTMRSRYEELGVERQRFQRFLRAAFAQKRKTLANNMRNAGYETSEVQAAMSRAGVEPDIRAEACSLEQMADISKLLAGS